jgi:hypothetical protein
MGCQCNRHHSDSGVPLPGIKQNATSVELAVPNHVAADLEKIGNNNKKLVPCDLLASRRVAASGAAEGLAQRRVDDVDATFGLILMFFK